MKFLINTWELCYLFCIRFNFDVKMKTLNQEVSRIRKIEELTGTF